VLDNDGRSHRSLRERLAEWTDEDVAQHQLGLVLGVLPPLLEGETEGDHFRRCKGIFWSANGLGDALHGALMGLVDVGLLEQQPDEDGTVHGASALRFVPEPPTEDTPGR